MSDMGIGIIGAGFMGQTYSEVIAKYCKNAQLKVVCDVNEGRAAEIAHKYGVHWTGNVEDLVARDDISVVFVETPHCEHVGNALAAVHAGKHVMIEKPMTCSVADCDAIIAACKKAGVLCSIGFQQRSRKCNAKAKEIIDSGKIGRIRTLLEVFVDDGDLEQFPAWQYDKAKNIGVLIGHGIHVFDRIRWLAGAEIQTVYAKCDRLRSDIEIDDTAMILMTLSNGVTVTFWMCVNLPGPTFPHMLLRCFITGEKGLIDLDAYGECKTNIGGEWKVQHVQQPLNYLGKDKLSPTRLQAYADHAQGFIDAIIENRQPPITGWDGRQSVAAALAAYESSQTGKIVSL